MQGYLKEKNEKTSEILKKMKAVRDLEIENCGENAHLFTQVVTELTYRVADKPCFGEKRLCPKCETPIPKEPYNHYCGLCGQFIDK